MGTAPRGTAPSDTTLLLAAVRRVERPEACAPAGRFVRVVAGLACAPSSSPGRSP